VLWKGLGSGPCGRREVVILLVGFFNRGLLRRGTVTVLWFCWTVLNGRCGVN